MFERFRPERAKKRVVDRNRWPLRLIGEQPIAYVAHRFDVDQGIGRVGGTFEIDQRQPALRLSGGEHRGDLFFRRAGGEIEPAHTELAKDPGNQRLGGGVERRRMNDHVALTD